jgi:CheY-like chemotaxis protein
MNEKESFLAGKKILIVDDEPDILDTLEDLLPMSKVVTAASYKEAAALLDTQDFDVAILDIMGVSGYDLLEICTKKKITAVMLTAYAISPGDVRVSFEKGAAFYIPKEEMANIETFLTDVLTAKEKGENPWSRWYKRLSKFCERTFGPDWKDTEKELFDKITFH